MNINEDGWVVISTQGCSSCMMVKTLLDDNKIEYQPIMLSELTRYQKDTYMGMARAEGCMSMPIILNNNRIVTMPKLTRMMNGGNNNEID